MSYAAGGRVWGQSSGASRFWFLGPREETAATATIFSIVVKTRRIWGLKFVPRFQPK